MLLYMLLSKCTSNRMFIIKTWTSPSRVEWNTQLPFIHYSVPVSKDLQTLTAQSIFNTDYRTTEKQATRTTILLLFFFLKEGNKISPPPKATTPHKAFRSCIYEVQGSTGRSTSVAEPTYEFKNAKI